MKLPDLQEVAELIDSGRPEQARPGLESLLEVMPDHAAARVLLAHAFEREGNDEAAMEQWRAAARICPGNRMVLTRLAAVAVRLSGDVEVPSGPEGSVPSDYEDLDKLIEELKDARIVPDPDVETVPEEDMDDEIDDVVSETLARIYANQKYFEEAARVYEKLAIQQPERREEFLRRADEMRAGSGGAEDASDESGSDPS